MTKSEIEKLVDRVIRENPNSVTLAVEDFKDWPPPEIIARLNISYLALGAANVPIEELTKTYNRVDMGISPLDVAGMQGYLDRGCCLSVPLSGITAGSR